MKVKNMKRLRKFIFGLTEKQCNMSLIMSDDIPHMASVAERVLAGDRTSEHFCGTAGCFKGWTIAIQQVLGEQSDKNGQPLTAEGWLGLNLTEAENLFYTWPNRYGHSFDFTPKGGWRKWMLARLDRVIKSRTIHAARRAR